ncbi:MAG: hypothetical protein LBG80_07310, partial [Bacteroidales bacterium]|nr:hypothetical protein [Bacteroidales bacterium]
SQRLPRHEKQSAVCAIPFRFGKGGRGSRLEVSRFNNLGPNRAKASGTVGLSERFLYQSELLVYSGF